jgi:hypothetical protein
MEEQTLENDEAGAAVDARLERLLKVLELMPSESATEETHDRFFAAFEAYERDFLWDDEGSEEEDEQKDVVSRLLEYIAAALFENMNRLRNGQISVKAANAFVGGINKWLRKAKKSQKGLRSSNQPR